MFYEVQFRFRNLVCWHVAFSQDFSMVGLVYVNLSFKHFQVNLLQGSENNSIEEVQSLVLFCSKASYNLHHVCFKEL